MSDFMVLLIHFKQLSPGFSTQKLYQAKTRAYQSQITCIQQSDRLCKVVPVSSFQVEPFRLLARLPLIFFSDYLLSITIVSRRAESSHEFLNRLAQNNFDDNTWNQIEDSWRKISTEIYFRQIVLDNERANLFLWWYSVWTGFTSLNVIWGDESVGIVT